MSSPLQSLIACGTKLWLDSIDPDLVVSNRALGATGATSNPIIVSNLIKSGRFDTQLHELAQQGLSDEAVAWQMTDSLVSAAQEVFLPVWEETAGNDGYVSFELDPLLEDPELGPPHEERVARYIELGKKWAQGNKNRMIKIPATPAGLAAIEDLVAADVTLNVTLIFTQRQYCEARDAVWRGAQRRASLDSLKSVYSIFISRVDVYTVEHVPDLSPEAQGMVGLVGAKRLWADNEAFWADKALPLQQEIVLASTGKKLPEDSEWKYIEALVGSGIQTNPPATNDAVEASGLTFTSTIAQMPAEEILAEIDSKVDFEKLETALMAEGIQKFADPHKSLLELVAKKRAAMPAAS